MDEHLRDQLAAWLDFYRELGIEDFYRRPAGTGSAEAPAGADLLKSVASPSSCPEVTGRVVSRPLPAIGGGGLQPGAAPMARPASPVGPPARSLNLFEAPAVARRERETLDDVQNDLGDCHRCRLAAGRKTIVFGQGDPRAQLVLVGEGPGADEDEQGLPFVGRAGQLLNRMLQLIAVRREDVYICNVVKCRPPGNRTPERDEIETCSPFLFRQIRAIRPRLICCLGAPAVRTVLGLKEGITKIRGQFFDYAGAKALATVHPAYILRNPREEKILREDFEKIRDFLKSAT